MLGQKNYAIGGAKGNGNSGIEASNAEKAKGGYQLVHLLGVAILSLIIGALVYQ